MLEQCPACHKILRSEELLFMMNADLAFCNKKCCEIYLENYTNYFTEQEQRIRQELGLPEETDSSIISQLDLCQQVLEEPLESCMVEDLRGQPFIVQYGVVNYANEDYRLLIVYTVIDDENFFIYSMATKYHNLVQRLLHLLDQNNKTSGFDGDEVIDSELLAILDRKKSEQLINLMGEESVDDISFSQYIDYQEYGSQVLEEPDEIYCWYDSEGDECYTYYRVFAQGESSFYYVVLTVVVEQQQYPILMFPTKKRDVLVKFLQGQKLVGQVNN